MPEGKFCVKVAYIVCDLDHLRPVLTHGPQIAIKPSHKVKAAQR